MARRATGFLSVLLVALLALLALGAGGAAAADVEVANETVAVNDGTSSVFVEVNNSGNSTADLSVEWVGVDSEGNETGMLDSQTMSVSSGSADLVEYSDLNATETPKVKVTVTLDNATVSADTVSVKTGTFQQVEGGAGGFLDDSTGGLPNGVLAAGALVVVGLILRGRD